MGCNGGQARTLRAIPMCRTAHARVRTTRDRPEPTLGGETATCAAQRFGVILGRGAPIRPSWAALRRPPFRPSRSVRVDSGWYEYVRELNYTLQGLTLRPYDMPSGPRSRCDLPVKSRFEIASRSRSRNEDGTSRNWPLEHVVQLVGTSGPPGIVPIRSGAREWRRLP